MQVARAPAIRPCRFRDPWYNPDLVRGIDSFMPREREVPLDSSAVLLCAEAMERVPVS